MATVLNQAARRALSAGNLAHLVTLDADGGPQISIVWVGIESNEIVCAHLGAFRKVKNIKQEPRVALSMVTGGKNEIGLDYYLVVYGSAYVTEGGAAALLQRLAYTYIGPGVIFPPMDHPPDGYVTHIVAERVAGIGPWR